MHIIILSAGIGSRLRPYTKNLPKCLVKLCNIPILEHQLNIFEKVNIPKKSITIVGGYLCNKLNKYNLNIINNENYEKTNMVYSLFCALDKMNFHEDLIISYGDIVFEERVLKKLIESNNPITVVADTSWRDLWELRMENILDDAETFIFDKNLNILEIGKKPISLEYIKAQYIGLIKIKKEYLDDINLIYKKIIKSKNIKKNSYENIYMTEFLENIINFGIPTKACLIKKGWLEVDTSKDIETYNELFERKELSKFYKLN